MGPRAPDWGYLETLQPEDLEEEDADKVLVLLLYLLPLILLLILLLLLLPQVYQQLHSWKPGEGDARAGLAFGLVQVSTHTGQLRDCFVEKSDFQSIKRFLFQRAQCNLNFVFCFQISKIIFIIEHTRLKPKKFSIL